MQLHHLEIWGFFGFSSTNSLSHFLSQIFVSIILQEKKVNRKSKVSLTRLNSFLVMVYMDGVIRKWCYMWDNGLRSFYCITHTDLVVLYDSLNSVNDTLIESNFNIFGSLVKYYDRSVLKYFIEVKGKKHIFNSIVIAKKV